MIDKIAFLFLVISDVYHQDNWKNFFYGQDDAAYSIYVHTKESLPKESFFKPYEMSTKVPTTWANTMNAQIAMLKEALKDPANKKFIFVSETTIPIATFEHVYETLLRHDKSIFDFYPSPHLKGRPCYFKPRILPLPDDIQYCSPQWVVLNRKHAELMVNDTYYITIATSQPCDQEHYPATLLAAHHLLDEVEIRDTTFVLWEKGINGTEPYTFFSLDDPKQFEHARRTCSRDWLFARKFHKNCNLDKLNHYLVYMQPKKPKK